MLIVMTSKKRIALYFTFFMSGVILATGLKAINRRSIMTMGENRQAYVAIIIDDFGNGSKGTEKMLSLPIKFTGAVMPAMPKSEEEASQLYERGNDVILHQPMEPHNGKLSWLGQAPILATDSKQKARQVLINNLSQIPHCIGVNNHMGSKVSENKALMEEILIELKNKNLLFVDSMTTPSSVTKEVADKVGTDLIKRDVFLDSTQNIKQIEANLLKAGDIALEKGYAVAIGHVGAEGGEVTYKAIMNTYKELEEKGIKFVTISKLNEIIKK